MEAKTIIAIVLAAMLCLTGCAVPDGTIDVPVEDITADDSMAVPENILSTTDANNQFALELYLNLTKESNVFFSPYSISTALAMTYEGARGETARQIADVFHFNEDDESRRSSFAAIYNILNKESPKYELSTANALWAEQTYPFLTNYTSAIGTYYGGRLTNLDFKTQQEPSRQTINKWVEEKTKNKIENLLPEGSILPITRLVLTNAIYFKGEWVKKFNKRDTRDMDFMINNEQSVKVPMMKRTDKDAKFNYANTGSIQMLEMLYDGANLSMLVLLPKPGEMEKLEQNLTIENLNQWKSMMHERKIDVYIPKFKFTQKYALSKNLREMGMPLAFSPEGYADFSGMDGTKNLYIQQVYHKAFIDVNEEGTEAAAATGVVVGTTSIMERFMANHPFIFIIQEKTTGSILFMGKVVNPAE